ncbi:MAG: hydroxymyristoyl-ACP dehydratase [Geobacteraceae bacterium]|nr:hydroxymyristoyl-ACP dehydratase [Geobacteraceae bacterium]
MESMSWGREGFSSSPTDYLPHRSPFLLIDRVTSRDPGVAATGIKVIPDDAGSFPVFLLVESIAQLGGIAAATGEGGGGFLAAIDHAGFFREVRQGECVAITARIAKSFGRLFLLEGEASVNGERVAEARLTLGIGAI